MHIQEVFDVVQHLVVFFSKCIDHFAVNENRTILTALLYDLIKLISLKNALIIFNIFVKLLYLPFILVVANLHFHDRYVNNYSFYFSAFTDMSEEALESQQKNWIFFSCS